MIKSARIKFDKLLGETPRAYFIKFNGKQVWIPKSMSRNFITNKKLGGNVVLPAFILNDILGFDINERETDLIEPTYIVTKHTPERKEPVQNNTINELKK